MRTRALVLVAPILLLAGCRFSETRLDWGLERMIDQEKYDAYEPTGLFPDGKVMRDPPVGTVPREREFPSKSVYATGLEADSSYATRVPLAMDRAFLDYGRNRFEIYCGACHGKDGTGVSMVAAAMPLRQPPSLHQERIRRMPPGQIFHIVTEGYGLMPAYQEQLGVRARWAVAAYVKALQLSHRVPLSVLPDSLRTDFSRSMLERRDTLSGDTLHVTPMRSGR